MANEPVDMIMPMLREIRGEMHEIRGELGAVKQQLHKLEIGQRVFAMR